MTAQQLAESLGIAFSKQTPGYLNLCIRSGNQLITSGHVSDLKGKLGGDVSTESGYQAARNCAEKILNSVWNCHGTLDGLCIQFSARKATATMPGVRWVLRSCLRARPLRWRRSSRCFKRTGAQGVCIFQQSGPSTPRARSPSCAQTRIAPKRWQSSEGE